MMGGGGLVLLVIGDILDVSERKHKQNRSNWLITVSLAVSGAASAPWFRGGGDRASRPRCSRSPIDNTGCVRSDARI